MGSQAWVAFFGGVAAITCIAFVNSGRLQLEPRRRWAILLLGLAAIVALVPVWIYFDFESRENRMELRWISRGVAVIVYLIFVALQRHPDSTYGILQHGEYASLWLPGIGAIVVLGLVQVFALALLARFVRGFLA